MSEVFWNSAVIEPAEHWFKHHVPQRPHSVTGDDDDDDSDNNIRQR